MLYFSIQNASPRWDEEGLRGGGCEMTISCSDYPRIILESFQCNLELKDFVAGAVFGEVRG